MYKIDLKLKKLIPDFPVGFGETYHDKLKKANLHPN